MMGDFLAKDVSPRNTDIFGNRIMREQLDLPVKVYEDQWTVLKNPNRLMRIFKFDNDFLMSKFVIKILKYQMRVDHHGTILIEHGEVRVEVYNFELRDITNADLKYAKNLDEFYDEIVTFVELDEGAL